MFASTELFIVQADLRSSECCNITNGLAVQRTHLRPLERDRRTFRVMLVVGVRHLSGCDDVVELPGEDAASVSGGVFGVSVAHGAPVEEVE